MDPATDDGTISGVEAQKVQNLALFMVARVDTVEEVISFGFGWYDHLPWENGVFIGSMKATPTFGIGGRAPLSCSQCFIRVNLADNSHT